MFLFGKALFLRVHRLCGSWKRATLFSYLVFANFGCLWCVKQSKTCFNFNCKIFRQICPEIPFLPLWPFLVLQRIVYTFVSLDFSVEVSFWPPVKISPVAQYVIISGVILANVWNGKQNDYGKCVGIALSISKATANLDFIDDGHRLVRTFSFTAHFWNFPLVQSCYGAGFYSPCNWNAAPRFEVSASYCQKLPKKLTAEGTEILFSDTQNVLHLEIHKAI